MKKMFFNKNKNKYQELHLEQAIKITKNEFCKSCREHEGSCRESYEENPRCLTFNRVVEKIKRIFDKYDGEWI